MFNIDKNNVISVIITCIMGTILVCLYEGYILNKMYLFPRVLISTLFFWFFLGVIISIYLGMTSFWYNKIKSKCNIESFLNSVRRTGYDTLCIFNILYVVIAYMFPLNIKSTYTFIILELIPILIYGIILSIIYYGYLLKIKKLDKNFYRRYGLLKNKS